MLAVGYQVGSVSCSGHGYVEEAPFFGGGICVVAGCAGEDQFE